MLHQKNFLECKGQNGERLMETNAMGEGGARHTLDTPTCMNSYDLRGWLLVFYSSSLPPTNEERWTANQELQQCIKQVETGTKSEEDADTESEIKISLSLWVKKTHI